MPCRHYVRLCAEASLVARGSRPTAVGAARRTGKGDVSRHLSLGASSSSSFAVIGVAAPSIDYAALIWPRQLLAEAKPWRVSLRAFSLLSESTFKLEFSGLTSSLCPLSRQWLPPTNSILMESAPGWCLRASIDTTEDSLTVFVACLLFLCGTTVIRVTVALGG